MRKLVSYFPSFLKIYRAIEFWLLEYYTKFWCTKWWMQPPCERWYVQERRKWLGLSLEKLLERQSFKQIIAFSTEQFWRKCNWTCQVGAFFLWWVLFVCLLLCFHAIESFLFIFCTILYVFGLFVFENGAKIWIYVLYVLFFWSSFLWFSFSNVIWHDLVYS